MHTLGQYVLQLTASTLICGILLFLFPEGTVQKLLRLTCGVFLTVTALAPLPGLELPDTVLLGEYATTGAELAALGNELGAAAVNECIIQTMDAYILDKAATLELTLQTDITLDEKGIPSGVILQGSWTEETRQALADVITKDLGIPEEDQQWVQETLERESENGLENTAGRS